MPREVRFEYRPLPIYEPFHATAAQERLLVGGFGSGKTWAICADSLAFGLEQPGSRVLMTRKTAPELRDTLEPEFIGTMPHELLQASEVRRAGGHIESITLPNGTVFLFRSIDDWRKLKSLNLAAIYWDELNEFDEETYMGMQGRLRQREPTAEAKALGYKQITRRGSTAGTNPAGRDWVWRRFVKDGGVQGTVHWTATTLDNPTLPVEYVESLLSYPEPWVRRYVLCQFDDFAGQIYEEWAFDTHVIKEQVRIPSNGLVWMGMDPGTRNPTAGLWVWADRENNRLIGVAEYKETRLDAAQHAASWRQIEGKLPPVRWRVSDPTAIGVPDRGTNMTLRDQYARLGFHFQPGPKDHKDRIPMLGAMIVQRRFLLTRACMQTFEQIRDYQWEDLTPTQRAREESPRERPLKSNDDLVDTAQYLSSRWSRPMKPRQADPNMTPAQEFSRDTQAIIRRQLRKPRYDGAHDLGSMAV